MGISTVGNIGVLTFGVSSSKILVYELVKLNQNIIMSGYGGFHSPPTKHRSYSAKYVLESR